MRIAFAGNPNSGKTTMYNVLTGKSEQVGNWAGVTVDKKEATIRGAFYSGAQKLVAVDLPGAYSMSPFTSEESVTSDYIKTEAPDVIVNIVDATNLSRSLFFTTQLLELGIPIVVALNKSDINKKKKNKIDTAVLSKELGCPVFKTVSAGLSHEGLKEVVTAAVSLYGRSQTAPFEQHSVNYSDRKAVEAADRRRYSYVNALVKRVEKRSVRTNEINSQDKFDNIITNKWVGIPIFVAVMFLVFQLSQAWVGPWIAGYLTAGIDAVKDWAAKSLEGGNVFLVGLLTEGVIGGVSAVVGFLPLVMVMYFLIALLEDCGYMARATVVLDPIFKKVGLSGKSAIPFVIGTGCAVPGVMACRTIKNENERNATAMLAPFMPCGAKLPVIALFAGVFFEDVSWVGTLMYFAGIIIILLCALIVNGVTGSRFKKSYFIIELPEYKVPSLLRASLSMCSRGWSYIKKAATVILLCNAVVYVMQSFDWGFKLVGENTQSNSILASVAGPVAYLLIPVIGIRAWQMAAAAITGFIAKENVVGTLAVCYGISNMINSEELTVNAGAQGEIAKTFGLTAVGALAYLVFNLFSPPCFAAIGAMNAEVSGKKWLFGGIALQLSVGYTSAYLVYTIGTLIVSPEKLALLPALFGGVAVAAMAVVVAVLIIKAKRKARA